MNLIEQEISIPAIQSVIGLALTMAGLALLADMPVLILQHQILYFHNLSVFSKCFSCSLLNGQKNRHMFSLGIRGLELGFWIRGLGLELRLCLG